MSSVSLNADLAAGGAPEDNSSHAKLIKSNNARLMLAAFMNRKINMIFNYEFIHTHRIQFLSISSMRVDRAPFLS